MKFHKGKFLKRMIDTYKTPVEEEVSWIDESNEYGFHKNEKNIWTATDIASGMVVCSGGTRKACVEWIENHKEKIDNRRLKEDYIKVVSFMNNYKKKNT